jgi:NTE family protein
MGALVGGVYAAGKLDQYRNWVGSMQKYDVWRMLDWTLTGGGFIKGDRIMNALRDLVGETRIEDLSIPYTAVAVDIDTQREVWLSRGSLFDAIRASIATPAIFRPYRNRGRTLVDGGLLNPVPVSATLRDLTDCTIAVDVNALAESLGSDEIDMSAGSLLASDGALRASRGRRARPCRAGIPRGDRAPGCCACGTWRGRVLEQDREAARLVFRKARTSRGPA